MSANTGGPAFPLAASTGDPRDGVYCQNGMTLLDYMAGQALAGLYGAANDQSYKLRIEGKEPIKRSDVAKDCYSMAEAMLAEKARREATGKDGSQVDDHSPDAGKMALDAFAADALRRLAANVLPADIKDAAKDQPLTWCAEQVRARVNTLRVVNMELAQVLGEVIDWDGYSIESANSLQRARAAIAKAKEVA